MEEVSTIDPRFRADRLEKKDGWEATRGSSPKRVRYGAREVNVPVSGFGQDGPSGSAISRTSHPPPSWGVAAVHADVRISDFRESTEARSWLCRDDANYRHDVVP